MTVPTVLSQQPWCKALATSPTWKLVPTHSLVKHTESSENALVAGLLYNDSTIRALDSYLKTNGPEGLILCDHKAEARMIIDLGHGVDGMANTCHGGLIALLIDEIAGMLASVIWDRYPLVTGELTTSYKKRLATPNTVLCHAWVAEGGMAERKICIKVSVEDGAGVVYATGHTIFVKLKAKP